VSPELVEKGRWPFPKEGIAACCSAPAGKAVGHVCRLRGVFSPAHVSGKNGFDFISPSAEDETLRGFLPATPPKDFLTSAKAVGLFLLLPDRPLIQGVSILYPSLYPSFAFVSSRKGPAAGSQRFQAADPFFMLSSLMF
jgi:hypothetical protein